MNRRTFIEYLFDTGISAYLGLVYIPKLMVPVTKIKTNEELVREFLGKIVEEIWRNSYNSIEVDWWYQNSPSFTPPYKGREGLDLKYNAYWLFTRRMDSNYVYLKQVPYKDFIEYSIKERNNALFNP